VQLACAFICPPIREQTKSMSTHHFQITSKALEKKFIEMKVNLNHFIGTLKGSHDHPRSRITLSPRTFLLHHPSSILFPFLKHHHSISFRHLIKYNASTMPRSQNYLLQSRSPSPPSPLTDLASPTIEAAPPSSIEAQSQLCECNTRWQHNFFGCAYSSLPFPFAQPSSFPPSSSGLVGS
jgi:hypothetical protein